LKGRDEKKHTTYKKNSRNRGSEIRRCHREKKRGGEMSPGYAGMKSSDPRIKVLSLGQPTFWGNHLTSGTRSNNWTVRKSGALGQPKKKVGGENRQAESTQTKNAVR